MLLVTECAEIYHVYMVTGFRMPRFRHRGVRAPVEDDLRPAKGHGLVSVTVQDHLGFVLGYEQFECSLSVIEETLTSLDRQSLRDVRRTEDSAFFDALHDMYR